MRGTMNDILILRGARNDMFDYYEADRGDKFRSCGFMYFTFSVPPRFFMIDGKITIPRPKWSIKS